MNGSGNTLLVQTSSSSDGIIRSSAFGISGEHGAISQVGSMEQSGPYNGVRTFRIYLQGSYSTSTTTSGQGGANIGLRSTSVSATAGYSSTSGGFQSNIYVVTGNMMDGCPVALSSVILPPDTPIEPLPE